MAIADLRPTDDVLELRARVREFMEEHVYPSELTLNREDAEADALVERLRGLARDQGLWAPHLPPEAGGSSGSFLVYAFLNEEIDIIQPQATADILTQLEFLETLTRWYDSVKRLPRKTLLKMMRMGERIAKVIGE